MTTPPLDRWAEDEALRELARLARDEASQGTCWSFSRFRGNSPGDGFAARG